MLYSNLLKSAVFCLGLIQTIVSKIPEKKSLIQNSISLVIFSWLSVGFYNLFQIDNSPILPSVNYQTVSMECSGSGLYGNRLSSRDEAIEAENTGGCVDLKSHGTVIDVKKAIENHSYKECRLARHDWPASGEIISNYDKSRNLGLNIKLSEGTNIKASDDGVVFYSSNELPGYGNLIILRHDSGFVTAYAHNKDLLVRKGDRVDRGQIIATSGQTGNVSSPQLHFEIRGKAGPLDPVRCLYGNG